MPPPQDAATPRPHDALFRSAFEHPADAVGELRHVLPPPLAVLIDAASLQLESASFIDPDLAGCHSDLLFSARIGGEAALVYFLLEHQSTVDRRMPLRMLAYLVRIWERYVGDHPRARRLPPIVPVLVSHVPGGWTAATDFHALVHPAPATIPGLAPLVPSFHILVDDLAHATNDDLQARALAPFPKIALWLLRDGRDPDALLDHLVAWAAALQEVARAPDGWRAMLVLLSYLNAVLDRERFATFRGKMVELAPPTEDLVMRYSDAMIEQGREQGLEQGRTEGLRAALTKQLTRKFGSLDATALARIEAASPADLDRWLERVLDADRLETVLDA